MAWDPSKVPGPSRLKRKAQPQPPNSFDLGPPILTPSSVAENPTEVIAADDPMSDFAPFLLSYKDVQVCSAELHHSPATPAEAYAIASRNNIRHCVCPGCADLIAAQLVCYYAKQRLPKDEAAAYHKHPDRLELALRLARRTVKLVDGAVRLKQAKFYEDFIPTAVDPSGDTHADEASHQKSVRLNDPVTSKSGDHTPDTRIERLNTSGLKLEFCKFYHYDQETTEPDEECNCKPPDDLPEDADEPTPRSAHGSSAPIAAALLVAALTFGALALLNSKKPRELPRYLGTNECRHRLPEEPRIPAAHVDDLVTAYAPHSRMCLPCARLVAARRAWLAAPQAAYEAEYVDDTETETPHETGSLHTTWKQAERLVEWRERAHRAIVSEFPEAGCFECNVIEKGFAYDKSEIGLVGFVDG